MRGGVSWAVSRVLSVKNGNGGIYSELIRVLKKPEKCFMYRYWENAVPVHEPSKCQKHNFWTSCTGTGKRLYRFMHIRKLNFCYGHRNEPNLIPTLPNNIITSKLTFYYSPSVQYTTEYVYPYTPTNIYAT